jgi:hypothetical protein
MGTPDPAMVNARAAAKVQEKLKSNCGDYEPPAWHGRGCDAANRLDDNVSLLVTTPATCRSTRRERSL